VRFPLSSIEAERAFHRLASRLADSLARTGAMIADADTPLIAAYEHQRRALRHIFEAAIDGFLNEESGRAARAYRRGDRTDDLAAVAAYLREAVWRLQQMYTVTETNFFPIILRYPESVVLNVRFANGHVRDRGVHFESPGHSSEQLGGYAQAYRDDCRVSQRRAAERFEEQARIFEREFPDPDDVPRRARECGGVAWIAGRSGSEFTSVLQAVDPDPDRFGSPPETPRLVPAGPTARRTVSTLLPEDAVVL
jgi:hypothetical protein